MWQRTGRGDEGFRGRSSGKSLYAPMVLLAWLETNMHLLLSLQNGLNLPSPKFSSNLIPGFYTRMSGSVPILLLRKAHDETGS